MNMLKTVVCTIREVLVNFLLLIESTTEKNAPLSMRREEKRFRSRSYVIENRQNFRIDPRQ